MPTPRAGYRTKDGVKVPSVTTILGRFKDSGGLIKWAYKQGREHENLAMRNLPAPAHLYDTVGDAAQAGTIAHSLVEAHVAGKDVLEFAKQYADDKPDVKRRAWNAYQQYLEWLSNSKIQITHTEMGLVSEKYGFGGTLDFLGLNMAPARILGDVKTSNKVYGDHLIQLGAYSLLVEECLPDLAPTGGYHLLRFARETADFAHHYYGELVKEKRAFLLMRELYDLTYGIERRA